MWTSLVLGASLSLGGSPDCTAPATAVSFDPCSTSCVDAALCSPCCTPCCRRMNCLDWLHFHSTCDLYPHYWYQPESHGYYSFRPYNWQHVEQARTAIPGRDLKYPFSTDSIDVLEASAGNEKTRASTKNSDMIRPRGQHLPSVELWIETK
jgi:hypothetical protein